MTMDERGAELLDLSLRSFDESYSEESGLVADEEGRDGTRGSANYALALLMRGGRDERAARTIRAVIDCQFAEPGTVYRGTFRQRRDSPTPPPAPVVWRDYDPNWREFIAMVFAAILAEFEGRLPADLVADMERSAALAVAGTIDRVLADDVPLNTNIELMHLFTADFFGRRLGEARFAEAARAEAERLLATFRPTGAVSEFNSTTYYGVDFMALSCIRRWSRTPEVRAAAEEIDAGLWDCLAEFYSVGLENPSGPYSRCYAMEMTSHSSLGSIFYLSLGEAWRHLAVPNCEQFADPLIVLSGAEIPPRLKDAFTVPRGDRLVRRHFIELCERHPKGGRNFLCTATAFVSEELMIGGLSGSRNTSGQLHPATVFWKCGTGRCWMRLSRRRPGGHWSEHLEGIRFECAAERDRLSCAVILEGGADIEVFLEFGGPGMAGAEFSDSRWTLPGLSVRGSFAADGVGVRRAGDRVELYAVASGNAPARMKIELKDFRLTSPR